MNTYLINDRSFKINKIFINPIYIHMKKLLLKDTIILLFLKGMTEHVYAFNKVNYVQ